MIISTSLIHGQEILNMAKKETTGQSNKQSFINSMCSKIISEHIINEA